MAKLTNGRSPFEPVTYGDARPFRPEFGEGNIDELKAKLSSIRWGPEGGLLPEEDESKDSGLQPSEKLLRKLVEEWKALDFSRVESQIQRHQHFLVDIDWCKPLHFLHRRSSRADAIPLILIHGWPGSIIEFEHVIDLLAEPSSSADPAFHVVVPSLPGFAWSKGPPTKAPGIGDADGYCRILDTLMTQVLGYRAYAAQGGDWGSVHARCLGAKFARPDGKTGCRAVHLNFSPIVPKYVWALAALPDWLTDPAMPYLPGEYGKNIRMMDAYQKNMAYYLVQNSKPQQLAPGLIDSPVGLLAWLGWFWALKLDSSPTFSMERMLTVCTIYFCTRSIGTSFLPYHNNAFFSTIHGDSAYNVRHGNLGYSDFPEELVNVSHSWLKSTGNLKFYVKATRGGHFAALEQPAIFVNHLRLAFAVHTTAVRDKAALEKQGVLDARITASLWSDKFTEANSRTTGNSSRL